MKKDKYLEDTILQNLHIKGYKAVTVSINHVAEIERNIKNLLSKKLISKDFIKNEPSNFFKFIPDDAKSVLIIAFPSLITNVYFKIKGKNLKTIIPPAYIYKAEIKNILHILNKNLGRNNYIAVKNNLPLKYLSVKSGLGKYGRNNISYIEGMGSYLRLAGFYLRVEPKEDNWKDFTMLERCRTCTNCIKICPTKTITEDSFLVRAERCLTYFNESEESFPSWIKKEWHNALVGCIKCQKVCPENKDLNDKIEAEFYFDEFETRNILKYRSAGDLNKSTFEKLNKIGFEDDVFILSRNLKNLIG